MKYSSCEIKKASTNTLFLFTIFLLLFPRAALAWVGQVERVTDGDTLIVSRATGEQVCIRLYGIDAPELRGRDSTPQPFSRKAMDFLDKLLRNKNGSGYGKVSVMDLGKDKYDRTVAGIVNLPDGTLVQEEMLKAGMAWVSPRYCKKCLEWLALQEEAREAGRGLWLDKSSTPPWEWRKPKTQKASLR